MDDDDDLVTVVCWKISARQTNKCQPNDLVKVLGRNGMGAGLCIRTVHNPFSKTSARAPHTPKCTHVFFCVKFFNETFPPFEAQIDSVIDFEANDEKPLAVSSVDLEQWTLAQTQSRIQSMIVLFNVAALFRIL